MGDNERRLIVALSTETWTSAADLARVLGVTTRTVRNYVTRLNREAGGEQAAGTAPLIESSSQGYRLARTSSLPLSRNRGEDLSTLIIGRLVSAHRPLGIYDLADELHVSDSTLARAVREARAAVEPFGLGIDTRRGKISLEGAELNKRHLMAHLLSSESSHGFLEFTKGSLLSRPYDATVVARLVEDALNAQGRTFNDYGLSNIVMHAIVMSERSSDEALLDSNVDTGEMRGTSAWRAAEAICRTLDTLDSGSTRLSACDAEIYYLSLIIASNSVSPSGWMVEKDNVSEFIQSEVVSLAHEAVTALEQAYGLEPFDEDFQVRLAVHLHGLLQRSRTGSFVRNPLAAETRQKYPLYYDMAVFVANEFTRRTGLAVNEDEIAFLSFHIGGYFEIRPPDALRVTCAFLYMGYHDLQVNALERIRKRFGDAISIVAEASVLTADTESLACDVVISSVPVEAPRSGAVVVVDPFVSDADLDAIGEQVRLAHARRRGAELSSALHSFLHPQLFRRNYYRRDAEDMVRGLVDDAVELELCAPSFADDVLARESLSSTAFFNQIAIPHSMTPSARRSFLSIVVNDRPLPWGDQEVRMVILLGLSETDRRSFRLLFDSLLEALSESSNVAALLDSADYDDFVARLQQIISPAAAAGDGAR